MKFRSLTLAPYPTWAFKSPQLATCSQCGRNGQMSVYLRGMRCKPTVAMPRRIRLGCATQTATSGKYSWYSRTICQKRRPNRRLAVDPTAAHQPHQGQSDVKSKSVISMHGKLGSESNGRGLSASHSPR